MATMATLAAVVPAIQKINASFASALPEFSDATNFDWLQDKIRSYALLAVPLLALLIVSSKVALGRDELGHYPSANIRRWWWEPKYFGRMRFLFNPHPALAAGYEKWKDSIFKITRADADILVMPKKYLEELRRIPTNILSSKHAHTIQLYGEYTSMHMLVDVEEHMSLMHRKINPNLAKISDIVLPAIGHAIKAELPECDDDWKPVNLMVTINRMFVLISCRFFIGDPGCYNPLWHKALLTFPESVLQTMVILRIVPSFLHPIVVRLLPQYWRIPAQQKIAQQVVLPIVEARRKAAKENPAWEKPFDFLQCMIDDDITDARILTQIQLLSSFAAVTTTTTVLVQALCDLIGREEDIQAIREEAKEVITEYGWTQRAFTKLHKLDSFLKESQRHNPPSLLTAGRVATQTITLSDGNVIPKGTFIALAADRVGKDPEIVPDPDTFDSMRWYRKRLEQHGDRDNGGTFQFTTSDNNNLHFGYGKNQCPGRFLAVLLSKAAIVTLLFRYDWKFQDGKSRPRNWYLDDFSFPDPLASVLIKRRRVDDEFLPECMKL